MRFDEGSEASHQSLPSFGVRLSVLCLDELIIHDVGPKNAGFDHI